MRLSVGYKIVLEKQITRTIVAHKEGLQKACNKVLAHTTIKINNAFTNASFLGSDN